MEDMGWTTAVNHQAYIIFVTPSPLKREGLTEVAVDGHEDQGVDAGIGTNVDQVLYNLAPHTAKGPDTHHIIRGREGHTEDDEH